MFWKKEGHGGKLFTWDGGPGGPDSEFVEHSTTTAGVQVSPRNSGITNSSGPGSQFASDKDPPLPPDVSSKREFPAIGSPPKKPANQEGADKWALSVALDDDF